MTAPATFIGPTAIRPTTLAAIGRERRLRALDTIRRFRVTVSKDGLTTRQEEFDRPPSLGELAARLGPDAFVVAFAAGTRAARPRAGRCAA